MTSPPLSYCFPRGREKRKREVRGRSEDGGTSESEACTAVLWYFQKPQFSLVPHPAFSSLWLKNTLRPSMQREARAWVAG